jgi:dipeptidyl aminopeptidase/acylaminoacyl peptidase
MGIRGRLIGAASALALAVSVVSYAMAASPPEGPRLALTIWSTNSHIRSVMTIDPSGADRVKLLAGHARKGVAAVPFEGPTWAASGDLLAFSGYVAKGPPRIFLVSPDGSALHAVPGTENATHPVLSPDGHTLAFSRALLRMPPTDPDHPLRSIRKGFFGTTAWVLDLVSGRQRQLTKWRDGLHNIPSSFSPDGSTLALTRSSPRKEQATALSLEDGVVTVLADNAEQAVYSPDGTRIAFVSYRDRNLVPGFDEPEAVSELYVKALADGKLWRLTQTHDRQESSPAWDPSGERLAYTQSTGTEAIGFGFKTVVMQVNADGTCARRVIGWPAAKRSRNSAALYGPVWQPGPGRDAGRIVC